MPFKTDIDIDVVKTIDREKYGVRAIVYDSVSQTIFPHPSGIYIADGMPIDEETGWAAIPATVAEEQGFSKIDLLSLNWLENFKDKNEFLRYMETEPNWSLLESSKFLSELSHIAGYDSLIGKLKPRNVEDLADLLALMRPGKKHLLGGYLKDKEAVRKILYKKVDDVYFKKSHAVAYALLIIAELNLLEFSYENT